MWATGWIAPSPLAVASQSQPASDGAPAAVPESVPATVATDQSVTSTRTTSPASSRATTAVAWTRGIGSVYAPPSGQARSTFSPVAERATLMAPPSPGVSVMAVLTFPFILKSSAMTSSGRRNQCARHSRRVRTIRLTGRSIVVARPRTVTVVGPSTFRLAAYGVETSRVLTVTCGTSPGRYRASAATSAPRRTNGSPPSVSGGTVTSATPTLALTATA